VKPAARREADRRLFMGTKKRGKVPVDGRERKHNPAACAERRGGSEK
jgi:hypothetical protein